MATPFGRINVSRSMGNEIPRLRKQDWYRGDCWASVFLTDFLRRHFSASRACTMDPSNDETTATGDENPCKEYWALKRKRRRENKKASKTEEASKAKKLEEGSSPADSIEEAQNAAPKVKKNKEIQFHDPRIVIDLSFGDQMNAKVRTSFGSLV